MKKTLVPSMTPAVTLTSSTMSAPGRNVKSMMPALFVKKIEARLYEGVDAVRKASPDEQLFKGIELLTVIFEISEMLEAVQIGLRGTLGLRTQHEG